MKLSFYLSLLLLFISLALGGSLIDRFVNTLSFAVANSTCGQMNCSTPDSGCPPFAFAQAACENDYCVYFPNFDMNVCTDPSQCGVSNCDCDQSGLSPGCKCANDTICACLNGVCQLSNGYLGEYCDENNDCNEAGTCIKNKCVFVGEGANCAYDSNCEPQLYCNDASVCAMRPLCNATTGAPSEAYCENSGLCYNGVCYPYYTQPVGSACVYPENCLPGLGCISTGNEIGTCQPVALGTECTDDDDCAAFTQDCVCTQPEDSFPMVCSDVGFGKCAKEYAAMLTCVMEYGCLIYDLADMTTACSQKCIYPVYELYCCNTCLYPEFVDNVQQNIVGSCAHHNITTVDCCSAYPCALTPTSEICKGYTH